MFPTRVYWVYQPWITIVSCLVNDGGFHRLERYLGSWGSWTKPWLETFEKSTNGTRGMDGDPMAPLFWTVGRPTQNWVWVNTYRYIFNGMNIHKSLLFWGSLMVPGFWHTANWFSDYEAWKDFPARHVWKNRRVFHRKWPVYEECHLTSQRRLLMILRLIFLAIEICHSCDVNMHPEPFGSIEFLAWVQQCTMVPTQQMNFGKRNHGFLDCALGNSFVFLWPVLRVPIIRRWYVIHRFPRKHEHVI